MATAVSVVLVKERHIVEAFERAGATSPSRARPLADLSVDADGIGMRRLRARSVVREAAPGAFYADLDVWRGLRRMRQRVLVVVLALVVALVAAVLATSGGLGAAR